MNGTNVAQRLNNLGKRSARLGQYGSFDSALNKRTVRHGNGIIFHILEHHFDSHDRAAHIHKHHDSITLLRLLDCSRDLLVARTKCSIFQAASSNYHCLRRHHMSVVHHCLGQSPRMRNENGSNHKRPLQ